MAAMIARVQVEAGPGGVGQVGDLPLPVRGVPLRRPPRPRRRDDGGAGPRTARPFVDQHHPVRIARVCACGPTVPGGTDAGSFALGVSRGNAARCSTSSPDAVRDSIPAVNLHA